MKMKRRTVRNIWMLTREYGNLAGAGGVKDVVAQLSRTLARWSGRRVSVVLPLYGFIHPEKHGITALADPANQHENLQFKVEMNYVGEERRETVMVWYTVIDRVRIYLLDSPRFAEKGDVYTYTEEEEKEVPFNKHGEGHFDYFAMNLLLQKATLQLLLLLQQKPDVIHCHDGHTGVLPAIICENPWLKSYFRHTGFLVTVHNAGKGYHQEVSDLPYAYAMTGLPWQVIMKSRLQGSFDPLIAAGHYGVINTVSENYANELQETDNDELTGWLGHHLLDMGVKFEGITNGIDPEDVYRLALADIVPGCSFDPLEEQSMVGKSNCKKLLLEKLSVVEGIEEVEQYGRLDGQQGYPLFTFIGRLSEQKGIDILLDACEDLLHKGNNFHLVILGSGGSIIESEVVDITRKNAGKVCFLRGFSTALANRVYGAGDFLLVPSRYEPCGLTDFIAQLFGNLPIVHSVGGLVKVLDGATGFSYRGNGVEMLVGAIKRAMAAYQDPQLIRDMQKKAVQRIEQKHTWKVVMKEYLQLYNKAILQNQWVD